MIVLVSDTSVLVDLERGQFLDSCFQLPFQFAVPDLLYKRELEGIGGPEMIARGLRIEELNKDELSVAQMIRSEHLKLSVPDAYSPVKNSFPFQLGIRSAGLWGIRQVVRVLRPKPTFW